jgi:hypothetical protein
MDDPEIDALLSPNKLSGHEHDKILDQVLRRAGKTSARSSLGWLAAPVAVAAALALYLVTRPPPGDYVGTRGAPEPSAPRIELVCVGAELTRCPAGSRLMFRISPTAEPGYLIAYAESRIDGSRIWYFSAEGETPLVAKGSNNDVPLGRGIKLGTEHAAATYDVHIFVARRPLTQSEAIALDPGSLLARKIVALTVVR